MAKRHFPDIGKTEPECFIPHGNYGKISIEGRDESGLQEED